MAPKKKILEDPTSALLRFFFFFSIIFDWEGKGSIRLFFPLALFLTIAIKTILLGLEVVNCEK